MCQKLGLIDWEHPKVVGGNLLDWASLWSGSVVAFVVAVVVTDAVVVVEKDDNVGTCNVVVIVVTYVVVIDAVLLTF